MSKKNSENNKSVQPTQNKLNLPGEPGGKTVLIRLRPGRGVGGIGGPGSEARVSTVYARELVETGYADIVGKQQPAPVPSDVAEESIEEE